MTMTKRLTLLLAFLVLFTGSGLASPVSENQPKGAAVEQELAGYPVTLAGKTLFHIRTNILSLRAADRAHLITMRLQKIAEDPDFIVGKLILKEEENVSIIAVGNEAVMSVTNEDARLEGRKRQELAAMRLKMVQNALTEQKNVYSTKAILMGALYTLTATIIVIVLFWLIGLLFHRVKVRLETWRGIHIRTIRFQSLEILNEGRLFAVMIISLKAIRILIILMLFYFYVPLVFSFFPWTRDFSTELFTYMTKPFVMIGQTVLDYLPNLFFLLVISLVFYYLIALCRFFFRAVEEGQITFPGFHADWAMPTFKIVRFLLLIFALISAFPYLPGSDSEAFKGVSIFVGVLLSLGSTSAVANIVSGLILTYMRPFKIGDRVKIADTVGDVIEKNLLVTRIRTIKNVDVTIPNAMILSNHITDYSAAALECGLILNTTVTIGYDAPWRTVHELLIAAARSTDKILEQPIPFVFQTALNDFNVTYELNAYTDAPNEMATIYSDLHRNILDRFHEAGVEIMSPNYAAIRDGSKAAIPAAQNYKR